MTGFEAACAAYSSRRQFLRREHDACAWWEEHDLSPGRETKGPALEIALAQEDDEDAAPADGRLEARNL